MSTVREAKQTRTPKTPDHTWAPADLERLGDGSLTIEIADALGGSPDPDSTTRLSAAIMYAVASELFELAELMKSGAVPSGRDGDYFHRLASRCDLAARIADVPAGDL